MDATLSETTFRKEAQTVHMPEGPPARRSGKLGDIIFLNLTRGAAILTLLLLAGIMLSLVVGAWPSIREFGLPFLWTAEWDPVQEKFGGLVMIYGTLMTSLIALIIAVPVSFGIALFLTELSPRWLKRPLGTAIELLAAIPSIVYGMWGLMVFAPILSTYVQQPLQAAFGTVPVLGALFSGAPVGIGILSAGIILAIMIIPFIAAVMRDVFEVTPRDAEGIGLRRRRDDLGSRMARRAAVHQDGRHRRRHARSRPGAGRDDGGDVRHRQLQPAEQPLTVRSSQFDHVGAGERVCRGDAGSARGLIDLPGPDPVLHHVRRAGHRASTCCCG